MYGRLTKDITSWGSCVKLRERVQVLCDHPIFCDIFLMDGFSPQVLFWPFPFLHDLPFLTRDSSNSTLNNEDETTTSRITLRSTPRTNHRKQTNNQNQEKNKQKTEAQTYIRLPTLPITPFLLPFPQLQPITRTTLCPAPNSLGFVYLTRVRTRAARRMHPPPKPPRNWAAQLGSRELAEGHRLVGGWGRG